MKNVKQAVREQYGKIGAGRKAVGCCQCGCSSGPNGGLKTGEGRGSRALGYSAEELAAVPQGADLGLGCGNPQAIAALRPGETVLDLGSGGGIDGFLAARQVGDAGRVIGVDITPEMVARASEAAAKAGASNVEFRLGEIEHLPLADAEADVIMSNCVINLSPDKPAVFREAFRVLKPGGRLAIADIVATAPLPDDVRRSVEAHVGCLAGAAGIDELESVLTATGFLNIRITPNSRSRELIREYAPGSGLENYVVSATIEAVRP